MGSLFETTTILKSNIAIRYGTFTLFIMFLFWQLNAIRCSHASKPSNNFEHDLNPNDDHHNLSWVTTFPMPDPTTVVNPVLQLDPEIGWPDTELRSKIAKVTSIFYSEPSLSTRTYERALLSHMEHNKIWGYKHYVQRRGQLGPWSKHSYLLKLLVDELAKSPSERLDWFFWHDADTLLMNDLLPLETFLPPPGDEWAHINLLVSNDREGLNDGVFLVRVCEWSIYFFAAGLSYPHFRPEVQLRHDEQGALNMLVREDKFKNNTIHAPQSWFNPYQDFGRDPTFPPEWNFQLEWFEPGDMLIHFPGTDSNLRPRIMKEWEDRRLNNWNLYNVPLNETRAYKNTTEFWQNGAKHEEARQKDYWRHYHLMAFDVGPKEDDITRAGIREIEERMTGVKSEAEIDAAVKAFQAERIPLKREAYRKAYLEMLNGTRPDKTYAV